jgi:hypothetical protein
MMVLLAVGPTMAFMLIALALGYSIVIKGDKEKGFLRAMGLVLGFFVVVMSFFMVLLFANLIRFDREVSMMSMKKPMAMQRTVMPMHPPMNR